MRIRELCLENESDWRDEISRIGADPGTWDRVCRKNHVLAFLVGPMPCPAASILKQAMLSAGADAIVSRHTITCSKKTTDALVLGPAKNLRRAVESLQEQPFGLSGLADRLEALLEGPDLPLRVRLRGRELSFQNPPLVMGVLNVTPDSFSDGGEYLDQTRAVDHALVMAEEGAAIVDIGGESTRPGAEEVSPDEQLRRTVPVVQALADALSDTVISVDTSSPRVASEALEAGAHVVNDVTALSVEGMAETVAEAGAGLVLMHMQGTPRTMQENPRYDDVVGEVYAFLEDRVSRAVEAGVERNRVMVDPGIGFGKLLSHNLSLLRRAGELRSTGCRVLVGHSRKSFLSQLTGIRSASERDPATALVTVMLANRVDILRVHDVRRTLEALKIARSMSGGD
jgi:dihydropteroate synthase